MQVNRLLVCLYSEGVVDMTTKSSGVEVLRMHRLSIQDSKCKAFVDLCFGGLFLLKGFRVIEGKDGPFVGMPRGKGKDGKWYPVGYPLTKEFKDVLSEVVLGAYESA